MSGRRALLILGQLVAPKCQVCIAGPSSDFKLLVIPPMLKLCPSLNYNICFQAIKRAALTRLGMRFSSQHVPLVLTSQLPPLRQNTKIFLQFCKRWPIKYPPQYPVQIQMFARISLLGVDNSTKWTRDLHLLIRQLRGDF